MFLAVYFLLRSYTSTVGYFETVPPFVPATLVSSRLLLSSLWYFWQTVEKSQTQKFFQRERQKQKKARVKALNLIFTTH